MNRSYSTWRRILSSLAIGALLAIPAVTHAQNNFTLAVQSISSSLTLSGGAFGLTYTPQVTGADVTSYSGTILANLTGGVLTFSGGSSITALVNPAGPFTTAPNPIGIEAGNYGPTASGVITGFGSSIVNGVYKNIVMNITAGTAQNGVAPTGMTMQIATGTLDYGILVLPSTPVSGSSNLAGVSGANTSASLVSFDGTTLILPVTFQTTGGSGRVENWNGTLLAVAIPEPTTIALLGGLGLGVGYYGYSRRRATKRLLEQKV